MTVPFMYCFRRLFNKFATIFLSLIFHFIFRTKKETLNFQILKCDGERNQKNSLFRGGLTAAKIFAKIIILIAEVPVISKTLKFPGITKQVQILNHRTAKKAFLEI